MASPQIIISNPGNMVPGTVLTTLPQAVVPSDAQMKEKEQASIKLFEQVWVAFHTIGSACILLCVGDLVAGIMGLVYRSVIAVSFSWAWSGFLFGIINGSLVLRAVKNKPHINLHWTNVSFGFGITTIIIHFVDLILAALGSCIYGRSYLSTSYYDSYYSYSSNSFAYYYKYSPINAETTRLVLLVLVVSLEIWQVTLGGRLRRHFASQRTPPPVSYTVLTVTQPAPINGQQQVAFMPNGYNMPAATMLPPSYQVSVNQMGVPVSATPGPM